MHTLMAKLHQDQSHTLMSVTKGAIWLSEETSASGLRSQLIFNCWMIRSTSWAMASRLIAVTLGNILCSTIIRFIWTNTGLWPNIIDKRYPDVSSSKTIQFTLAVRILCVRSKLNHANMKKTHTPLYLLKVYRHIVSSKHLCAEVEFQRDWNGCRFLFFSNDQYYPSLKASHSQRLVNSPSMFCSKLFPNLQSYMPIPIPLFFSLCIQVSLGFSVSPA